VEPASSARAAWLGREGSALTPGPTVAKDDPDPKPIFCYGLYLPELKETWLRLVEGRPVSAITTQFLEWCSEKLLAVGKKVLVLVCDNASWHRSQEVHLWISEHNRRVKNSGQGGVRSISCFLPKQSPWLNAISPSSCTATVEWWKPTDCSRPMS
jgi:hypothetical protein